MSAQRETRLMMGMPVTVEVADAHATAGTLNLVFDYFQTVDDRFSTYKPASEISRINAGQLRLEDASDDMRLIFELAEQTRRETYGYFDIRRAGQVDQAATGGHDIRLHPAFSGVDPAELGTTGARLHPAFSGVDPSGIVKGWAIREAANVLSRAGFHDYYVDAGGDIQVAGRSADGNPWRAGIRSPFDVHEIVKVVTLEDCGIATSGTYARGQHIYNPFAPGAALDEIVSLTVIGPDVYEADRFATAAFAMGRAGIYFIETLDGFEAYQIDSKGFATMTTGFKRYVLREQMADS